MKESQTTGPIVSKSPILLTGATGYIGGRLLRLLEQGGYRVRCFSRTPQYLKDRIGTSSEVVAGDALDPMALAEAMRGVETAFYMIHALGSKEAFEEQDRRAAENFALAAKAAQVKRIIYVGGLGTGSNLSSHLTSRHEVGQILRASGVLTIEFRASMVIGTGSLSYAMIQALVEKLPVMITPRWVSSLAQPIAIRDLLEYLLEAITVDVSESQIFEIGGADKASIADIMREYARQRGRSIFIIPVPVLTPYLSSLWLGLVTPLYARVGRKLIDSAQVDTVVNDNKALSVFKVRPVGIKTAIQRAIEREEKEIAETRWSDALSSAGDKPGHGGIVFGTRIIDSRRISVGAAPSQAFGPIRRIGGRSGWYFLNWIWKLRGFLDLLAGGVGVRRGRRDPEQLRVGDAVDWWRVEAFEPNRLVRFVAEMKVPGRAWLQFEVTPEGAGSIIQQTAIFDPAGIAGRLYWYVLYPVHVLVFSGMLREIGRRAQS